MAGRMTASSNGAGPSRHLCNTPRQVRYMIPASAPKGRRIAMEANGSSSSGPSDELPAPEAPATSEAASPVPEKGVADILVEAFQLYRKHGKALLLTCALLFVPASLVKSCALAALARPAGPADRVVAELQSAQARAAASGRALADAYARHADPATISRLQGDNREELERIATEAFGAERNGWGEFGVALLGFLGMAMTMFFLYGVIVPLTNGALTVAVADR